MINNKYQITDILKESKKKIIRKVMNNNKTYFIIKTFDKSDKKYFDAELNLYSLIKQPHLKGFGQIFQAFQNQGKYSLIISELGENLDQLRKKCGGRFTLKCTLMIGLQILDRIQEIHKLGFLHGDIKPANFLIGKGKMKHKIYLVDFQMSTPYIHNGTHIQHQHIQKFSGSLKFCSVQVNSQSTPSRRDEIESLLYSLVYLLKGDLPWGNLSSSSSMIDAYNQTCEIKKSKINQLLKGLPQIFQILLKNIKETKFQQEPKYQFIRNQIKSLMRKNGYQMDYKYDWQYV